MTHPDGELPKPMNPSLGSARRRGFRGGAIVVSAVLATAVFTGLAGCAGYQAFRDGQSKLADGQTEQGLAMLNKAMDLDPSNAEYRRTFFTQRESLLNGLLREAELALESGSFAIARQAFDKAQRMEPASKRAVEGAGRVDVVERHWKAVDAAAALTGASCSAFTVPLT